MRYLIATTAALLVLASPAAASVKYSDVTIPASDGVNLVGDVYLPNATGPMAARVRRRSSTPATRT